MRHVRSLSSDMVACLYAVSYCSNIPKVKSHRGTISLTKNWVAYLSYSNCLDDNKRAGTKVLGYVPKQHFLPLGFHGITTDLSIFLDEKLSNKA